MRGRNTTVLAVSVLGWTAACGGAVPEGATQTEYQWGCAQDLCLELGSGEESFEPVEQGQTMEVVLGPQGGFHIVVSLRVRAIDAATMSMSRLEKPVADYIVYRDGVALDTMEPMPLELMTRDASAFVFEHVGQHVLLSDERIAPIEQLPGATLRVETKLVDAEGVERISSVEVVARVPEVEGN